MDINPILEERRLAIAALKEIAEHDELVDEADAYHGLRNTAQDALKALGVLYGDQLQSTPAQPAPEQDDATCVHGRRMSSWCAGCGRASEPMLCPHGKGPTDYCQPCGRVNGGGP